MGRLSSSIREFITSFIELILTAELNEVDGTKFDVHTRSMTAVLGNFCNANYKSMDQVNHLASQTNTVLKYVHQNR